MGSEKGSLDTTDVGAIYSCFDNEHQHGLLALFEDEEMGK